VAAYYIKVWYFPRHKCDNNIRDCT